MTGHNITHLSFYYDHRPKDPINIDMMCDILTNLTYLTFSYYYNSPIDKLYQLTKLTHLTFGQSFNQPVNNLHLTKSLTHLTFGDSFNQPIDNLHLLTNLIHLEFGFSFNQSSDNLHILPILTHLTFGYNFNQPIISLPHNLTYLKFEGRYNQSIDNIINLAQLSHLYFGDHFDKPINSLHSTISTIHIGYYFKQYGSLLPTSLEKLVFDPSISRFNFMFCNLSKLKRLYKIVFNGIDIEYNHAKIEYVDKTAHISIISGDKSTAQTVYINNASAVYVKKDKIIVELSV